MSTSPQPPGEYRLENSAAIGRDFLRLQRQATHEGRGDAFLEAARTVRTRLQLAPLEFGEPIYRLPALRLEVRCASVRPLYIEFGVSEDQPLVFIRAVKLLSRS